MQVFENIITDRGSKYAVSGGHCTSAQDAKTFIKMLKRKKKFAKATHHSWAVVTANGALKGDDGESGAGNIILAMLERDEICDEIIVVTRWYGGKHLGGDRFRHVQDAVRYYLNASSDERAL
ncbi:MAG: YigZ family protein [Paracoccaceae bacterium]